MPLSSKQMIGRRTWKARPPRPTTKQSSPVEAFLHITDSPGGSKLITTGQRAAAVRGIQNFHMDTRGWSDIAYHYLVFQQAGPRPAQVFQGRARDAVPAAQLGHNTRTLAIAVYAAPGDVIYGHTRYLIEELLRLHPSVRVLGGHSDVVATDCPGDNGRAALGPIARAAGIARFDASNLG